MSQLASSLLILDAHHSALDIIATAAWARRNYNPTTILMPLAGYSHHVPLMRTVIKYIASRYQITFMPVYRHEEYAPKHIFMWFLCLYYPKSLSVQDRTKANSNYVSASIQALKGKNNIVIVAPYGSPIYFGQKIKYGVRKLLELNSQALITRSKFSLTNLKYLTCSHSYQFDQDLLSQYRALRV